MNFTDYIPILMEYGSILLTILAMLVFATNIIVEVIKRVVPLPTNVVTVVIAAIITELALWIACDVLRITVAWCYIIGALVLSVFVAYAAMLGFDKLKAAWISIQRHI